jgi:predicted deacylase
LKQGFKNGETIFSRDSSMVEMACAWQGVGPETRTTDRVPVVRRADGSAVELPMLVVRGRQAGKTLLVTAGVHGDEFEGMAALWQLGAELDPGELRGTLVAVPVVNGPAYEAGLRTNPDDRQDMARVFPGDPAGTVTEQLAHALTQRFIRHADFYLDLHSAGQYYQMPPLVGYQLRPEPLLSAQRAAARAMGLPLIWGTPGLPGRSLSAAAEFGVPALYTEIKGEGRCHRRDVIDYLEALRRLLGHLEMGPHRPAPAPAHFVEDDRPQAGFLQVQNRAPVGGFFEPAVGFFGRVQAHQRLGVIRDVFGNVVHVVEAPHPGLVVFLRTFPRVHAGDPVCTVLELDSTSSPDERATN